MSTAAAAAGSAARLDAVLATFPEVAIAVSGGVDSLTLARLAHRALGDRAVMRHAVSPAVPPEATSRVEALAARWGWSLELVDAGEMRDPDYLANPVDRCFFCKRDLYAVIRAGWAGPIVSGTNLDDLGDFRPGLNAAERHGVRHPFVEAGIGKEGIRGLAREAGLGEVAELPASPCLSSRIETGTTVTPARLALVLKVERLLVRRLGPGTLRCRLRASGLEVELEPALLARAGALEADLRAGIDALRARYGCGDLPVAFGPYRRGSAFLRGAGP